MKELRLIAQVRLAIPVTTVVCFLIVLESIPRIGDAEESKPDMVIRLQGSQNGQKFPVLLIHLKRGEIDAGHVRVRFPEGIDAWQNDGTHTRFYQDVRSPIWPAQLAMEPVGLPVSWTGDDKDVGFEMTFDNGMKLISRAKVEGASVVLSHELRNGTEIDFAQSKIWSCVQLVPSPSVSDQLMERTGVLVAGEFRLFRDLVPGFQSYPKEQAVNQRFTGYAKGNLPNGPNPRISPHPGLPDDRTKDVYFWHSRKPIECAAIATVSTDGEWSVAAVGAGAPSAWSNPGISCLHADPNGGRWKPGETLRITNSIHFVEGGTAALSDLLRQTAETANGGSTVRRTPAK
jgi:hypothetical protein